MNELINEISISFIFATPFILAGPSSTGLSELIIMWKGGTDGSTRRHAEVNLTCIYAFPC